VLDRLVQIPPPPELVKVSVSIKPVPFKPEKIEMVASNTDIWFAARRNPRLASLSVKFTVIAPAAVVPFAARPIR
jgi:hypothetical protein